jgi:hypothetical protein
LERDAVAPAGGDAFGEERGEFALQFVFVSEVEAQGFTVLAVAQEGGGLAGIVVAVVVKEDDVAAQLGPEAAGSLDFGKKEAAREEPAGLLSKTNKRRHLKGEF